MHVLASRSGLDSGIYEVVQPAPPADATRDVQDQFIEAWAQLAGAFAMDRMLGRVHALLYVSPDVLDVPGIAGRLALPTEIVELHVATLVEWGLAFAAEGGFVAEQDPWAWFVRIVGARHRKELMPVRGAIEALRDTARELARSDCSPKLSVTFQRIDRFAQFVGDFAKLVDTFVTLGAGPMLKLLKMTTRFVPRRAA